MKDPLPTFSYPVNRLRDTFPDLAYIHVVEPRVFGSRDETPVEAQTNESESNDFIREIWKSRPIISAGYRSAEEALEAAGKKGDIIALGRYFISNVSVALNAMINSPHENLMTLIYLIVSLICL